MKNSYKLSLEEFVLNDDVSVTSMNIDFLSIVPTSDDLPRDNALDYYENNGLTKQLFVLGMSTQILNVIHQCISQITHIL